MTVSRGGEGPVAEGGRFPPLGAPSELPPVIPGENPAPPRGRVS